MQAEPYVFTVKVSFQPVYHYNYLFFISEFAMYVGYGEIGAHDAVRVIFRGGGRKTCLTIYKSSAGKKAM